MPADDLRRPAVLRAGTVLTVDSGRTVLEGHDVLVVDGRIAAIGVGLVVPDGTDEIDARGGIVMPGMVDTHRHMWQTTTRGYGADWTLTQYFVWYYLNWGTKFRPEDIHAGNQLGALEALDAGVTTCVDWSHGLQTIDHADAAVDALASVPGRFVPAYGNIQDAPANWTGTPEFRKFFDRRAGDLEGFQIAFDVTGDPGFPEQPAFEAARELDLAVTTHAGVWGATGDDAVRLIHENGYGEARTVYVHASTLSADSYRRIAATCFPPCAPRWVPPAPKSTKRRTPAGKPSPTPPCTPSRSSSGPREAGHEHSGGTTRSAAWRSARRRTSCSSATTTRRR